tara:strand:- start:1470 stop:2237 length:768 start_codon:yes stop_codon:yes gene_type:complete
MTAMIDLNSDLGESYGAWRMGDDAAMLDIVTSANVACGFHGGDPLEMRRTVEMAVAKNVAIGAHPGFQDLQGFGRRRILGIPSDELQAMMLYQVGALQAIARAAGGDVTHVKIHGALGNMTSEDDAMAETCIRAVQALDPKLMFVAIAATALERAARKVGQPCVSEIYADRAYNDDATLVTRGKPGAVIHDPDKAADNVLAVIDSGCITSINGVKVPVSVETVCVHGDSPDAVRMAEVVRTRLDKAGVKVARFAG